MRACVRAWTSPLRPNATRVPVERVADTVLAVNRAQRTRLALKPRETRGKDDESALFARGTSNRIGAREREREGERERERV